MKITSVEVKVLEKRQRLCGSAAIVLDDCFKVRDILILEKESTGELHISMPSKKLGKNYFVALVHPITSEFRHEIEDTKWFVLGYLALLFVYRYVIIIVGGVTADNLSASFGQTVAASSGTAILGWLQNLLWIIAITYPIGYFIFQGKKIPQFFGTRSKNRAIREIRDIRDNTKPY